MNHFKGIKSGTERQTPSDATMCDILQVWFIFWSKDKQFQLYRMSKLQGFSAAGCGEHSNSATGTCFPDTG